MINEPSVVIGHSFQEAWVNAAKMLVQRNWEIRNLMVQMKNPVAFDDGLHQRFDGFCGQVGILPPRDVAYTIFPHDFYDKAHDAEHLFKLPASRDGSLTSTGRCWTGWKRSSKS